MPRFLRGITRSRWDTYPDVPRCSLGELKARMACFPYGKSQGVFRLSG